MKDCLWHRARFLLLISWGSITLASEESKTWAVDKPNFSVEASSVDIDVDEGTWMSLTVSPDGEYLAFDLLGDIYEIPISGGDAKSLTEGVAWDIHPQYSPNGRSIAYVSDRAGGDNLWVMNRASGESRQLTHESFRLVNSPFWSPDSQFIAARKHFTTSRSLGTGEVWLYHAESDKDSSGGVQVVKRPSPTFQKELGEPAFSPDGNYLYYTQNVSPGNMFVYRQDSNKEIFQIKRVDLQTGEVSTAVRGVGGSVRPTPSPDGTRLAFIRRVGGDSSLFVKHLETGMESLIVSGLDPDMQETWAVYGFYPSMAWMPGSNEIVYWAGGKIWRVGLGGTEPVEIPFKIQHSREFFEAPSPTIAVSPDTFSTKMVRFATRSPDGSAVVFESLGKLFIKKGDERPVRLTEHKTGFEYYPVWTPDGRQLVYMHWHDDALATLKSIDLKQGKSRSLFEAKGHYIEPSISSDGEHLVYRKLSGGRLRHGAFGERPGLYLLNLKTGENSFLRRDGVDAHIVGDDIYFTHRKRPMGRNSDTAKTVLFAMDLAGNSVREIANGLLATQFRVSPNKRWVAFREHYQVFVSPMQQTGKSIPLGPKEKSLPTKKLSVNGGIYLNWSNENSLSWSTGPEMTTVTLGDAPFTEESATETINLSMQVETAKPSGTVALTHARIITMNAERDVIESGTIIVTDNRIEAVGASDEVEVPIGAQIVDAKGKTIIPGIIDAHAHGRYGEGEIIVENNWNTLAHLALGVTTQHNPSSSAKLAFASAEYTNTGQILSTRIFSTGEIVYGAKSRSFAPVDSVEDALSHIRRLKAQGAISIKNYNQPRREQRQQVIEAARQENMFVVAEGGSLYHMDMNLVVDGSTGIEHNVPALKMYNDVTQLWQATNVGYTPTLVVTYGGLTSEDYYYQKYNVWEHPILSNFVPPSVLRPRSVRRVMAPESEFRDDDAAAVAKTLMDNGVTVNIGAHGQREGLASHWEMWSFVRGGMSPMQALSAATINPATYLGMDADLGSIEPGKLADLVVLTKNPLENIEYSDDVSHVMINGRFYRADTLAEQVTGDRPAPKLWWR